MSGQVCKFYLQGNCRFGDSCRFLHPGARPQTIQTGNRFGALSGGASSNAFGGQRNNDLPYHLSKEVIRKDLTEERPQWPLSAYGPGRDAPEQLFGGMPQEQSFEEIRIHLINGAASGNPQDAANEVDSLVQQALQKYHNATQNTDGAVKFILDGANKHPNRLDVCKQASGGVGGTGAFSTPTNTLASSGQTNAFGTPSQAANPFGTKPAQTAANGFGQPSALGAKPSPFGTPAFGQPSHPGGFGQPSQLGQQPQASGFGQPSALGPKPSPFGAPAFGQPAKLAFGQPSQPNSSGGFGQPSQASTATAFGQPSTLGERRSPFANTTANPFGSGTAPTQPPTSGGFGQPSTTQASPFGLSAPTASNTSSSNPFGQPAPSAAGSAGSNPFGQPTNSGAASSSTAFGQPAAAAVNPFAQAQTQQSSTQAGGPPSNVFNTQPLAPAAQNAQNPFAQALAAANRPQAPQNAGFGQPSGFGSRAPAPPGGTVAQVLVAEDPYAPDATRQHPPLGSYATKALDDRLVTFKGKEVMYNRLKEGMPPVPVITNFDGTFTRIWFPDGPPAYNKETEANEVEYDEPVQRQWEKFVTTGKFDGGLLPPIPPKREYCLWDF